MGMVDLLPCQKPMPGGFGASSTTRHSIPSYPYSLSFGATSSGVSVGVDTVNTANFIVLLRVVGSCRLRRVGVTGRSLIRPDERLLRLQRMRPSGRLHR